MLLPSPRSLTCLVLLALLVAGPAIAQDDEDEVGEYAKSGLYLTGMGVLSFQVASENHYANTFLTGPQIRGNVDPALGLDARAGYRLHPHWAVEASFGWLTNRDYESKDVTTGFKNHAVARSWTTMGDVKYYLWTEKFQPYLLAGAGYGKVYSKARSGPQVVLGYDRSVTEGGFIARFGAGFSRYVSWNTALTFEAGYQMPTGPLSDTDQLFLNWGLTLRFYGESY